MGKTLASAVALLVMAVACSSAPPEPVATPTVEPTPTATPFGVPTPTPPVPEDAILIGVAMADDGLLEEFDAPVLEAARVQVEQINAAGGLLGRPVAIQAIDTQSTLSGARDAANRLVEAGVDVLLVSCDFDFAAPTFEVAAAAELPVISPCSGDPRWADAGDGVFSMASSAAVEGQLLAARAVDRGFQTAALFVQVGLAEPEAQCAAFVETFEDLGGEIIESVEFADVSVTLLEERVTDIVIAEPRPDVVLVCGYPPIAQEAVFVMRNFSVAEPMMAGSTMDGDRWIANVPNIGNFEMLSYASVYGDDPDAGVAEFLEQFIAQTGNRPLSGLAVLGATAVDAWAQAVRAADSLDGAAVSAALADFDQQDVVGGPLTISPDDHLDRARPRRLMEVIDGRPAFVEILEPQSRN